jgi:hypothetical protein
MMRCLQVALAQQSVGYKKTVIVSVVVVSYKVRPLVVKQKALRHKAPKC